MNIKKTLTVIVAMLVVAHAAAQQQTLFDFDWRFLEGDAPGAEQPAFDDSGWQRVDLPHDWDISHAPEAGAPTKGGGGYYPGGVGWYRKTFRIEAPDKRTARDFKTDDLLRSLRFDGVYQRCSVYVNGQLAATHGYGYTPFSVDITPYINIKGTNTVAVRVDNSLQPNCRWYSGSGIYRHVWMQTADRLHFGEGGIFISTPVVMTERATVQVTVSVVNESSSVRKAQLFVDSEEQEMTVEPGQTATVATTFNIDEPRLWSPDTPNLYTARVRLVENGLTLDEQSVRYGVRAFVLNAMTGFVLNGKRMLINGACVHHDNGVLGAASFDAAEVRKVRLLKEAGFNLLRTAHNPPSQAFLDACDSLGMMVIDEAFDGWREQKTPYDYSTMFDSCSTADVRAMVLRDRCHPSIVSWSIGNEVMERKHIGVISSARSLVEEVQRRDPRRPVTEALCSWDDDWEIFDPHAEVLDVVGYNYMMHKHASDHQRDGHRVMWQTESYPRDAFVNWQRTAENIYIVGDIVWTGLDYLGEAGIGRTYYEGETPGEHYQGEHFPWHGAYCGDVDLTGWRKPISHYRDLLWNGSEQTLYMAVREPDGYRGKIHQTQWSVWPTWESWNWPGHEGKPVEVEVSTKAFAVSLYLNDKLVETRKVDESTQYQAVFTVPYEPGTLRAVAFDPQGEPIGMTTLATAGEPAALRLKTDRMVLAADGQDLAFIEVEVVDKEGRVVPDAAVPAKVVVDGKGVLMAAASADLQDLEPMTTDHVTTWHGRALVVVRSQRKAGKVQVAVSADGLPVARVALKSR